MDAHLLAAEIVRAVCELDDIPDAGHPDTILVTVQSLEAVIERRIEVAMYRAEASKSAQPAAPKCAECNGDGTVRRSFGYIPCDACGGKGF